MSLESGIIKLEDSVKLCLHKPSSVLKSYDIFLRRMQESKAICRCETIRSRRIASLSHATKL